jgi:prepilin-type N-terminal cleavage/methylation domain-containing protein
MPHNKSKNLTRMCGKSAFTMIELIFAIVIIGISVLSLPMMNQAVSRGIEGNIVQEAIFAASAQLNQITSYKWDENSTQPNDSLSKVVWTSANDCNATTKQRSGHVAQPLHRRCLDDNTTRPTNILGLEAGEVVIADFDDIDDNIKATADTILIDTSGGSVITSSQGYKKDYNSTVSVSYASFGNPAIINPTTALSQNMKQITVTISRSNRNLVV